MLRMPRARREIATGATRRWTALALACAAVLLLWIPVSTGLRFALNNPRMDELLFHVPNVLQFADHFPTLEEMRDTNLSMLPLFHGILGGLSRLTGDTLPALRAWMVLIGLCCVLLCALLARQLPRADWRLAILALASFPYFGVCYFTVMTDFPAFAALLGTVLAQTWYLRTGRPAVLLLSGAAGLAACLLRQNLIFVTAVFALVVLLRERARRDAPPRAPVRLIAALAVPALGVAFQLWLWGGPLPPAFMLRRAYYDPHSATYLLGILSIGANAGYYLIPAALVVAARRLGGISAAGRLAILGATLAGGIFCYRMRGPDLVSTYGTFRHGLSFLRDHAGFGASALVFVLALFSFIVVLDRSARRALEERRAPRGSLLLFAMLAGSLLVLGFGLFRIYERHILPVYAFAVLGLLDADPPGRDRLLRAGWAVTILSGLAHSILYAVTVYDFRT